MTAYFPVTILAFDDSMEMSIVMAREMFYAAAVARQHETDEQKRNQEKPVVVASQDGKPVRTFSDSMFQVDIALPDIERTDLVIVSGVWGNIENLIENCGESVEWIKQQYQQGATVASLHSGSFVLAETGLLDGKVATIYWRMIEQFKMRYPKVILQPEKSITSAGNLFCSAGVTSAVEMATYLMEKMWGANVAAKVSRHFQMDMPRVAPEFTLALDKQKNHADEHIHQAQQWMESNFSRNFMLDEVADKVGLTMRSFRRRFKTASGEAPMQYLQRIRLETAKNLLVSSALSVDQIAFRVGFEDANYFSRLFRKKNGMTPREYRALSSQ